MSTEDKKLYTVVSVTDEAPGVRTLELSPSTPFAAGQYITVYFPDENVPEGKAYSISSAPHEARFTITVKAMGAFSNRLYALRAGESFYGSDPYGFFYSEEKGTPLMLFAIGIGITPMRSIVLDCLRSEPEREITLCYGSRTKTDLVFAGDWRRIASEHPSFRATFFLSREDAEECEKGRMSAERVLALGAHETAEFMLCGSISFVRDMWKGLRSAGVAEERIYTEAFFTN